MRNVKILRYDSIAVSVRMMFTGQSVLYDNVKEDSRMLRPKQKTAFHNRKWSRFGSSLPLLILIGSEGLFKELLFYTKMTIKYFEYKEI